MWTSRDRRQDHRRGRRLRHRADRRVGDQREDFRLRGRQFAAGAFDRTLGFIYGLARGLVLVAIAYLFYGWLLPLDRQDDWVKNARSLPMIRQAAR